MHPCGLKKCFYKKKRRYQVNSGGGSKRLSFFVNFAIVQWENLKNWQFCSSYYSPFQDCGPSKDVKARHPFISKGSVDARHTSHMITKRRKLCGMRFWS